MVLALGQFLGRGNALIEVLNCLSGFPLGEDLLIADPEEFIIGQSLVDYLSRDHLPGFSSNEPSLPRSGTGPLRLPIPSHPAAASMLLYHPQFLHKVQARSNSLCLGLWRTEPMKHHKLLLAAIAGSP